MLAFVHRSVYTRAHVPVFAMGSGVPWHAYVTVCVCVRERERERERERFLPLLALARLQRVKFYTGISRRARAVRGLILTFCVFEFF